MRLIATRTRRTRPGAALPRPFWVVWAAATVSFLGDGIYSGAVPLLATSITTDPGQVALTTVLSRSGWITVGLISGVLVDRCSKTRVMWRVDAAPGLVVAAFAALTLTGHHSMAVLYGVSLLVGHRLLRTLALLLAAINAASRCVHATAASLLRLTLNATGLTAPAKRPVRPHPSRAPQVETASSPSSDHSVPGTLALTIRGVSAR